MKTSGIVDTVDQIKEFAALQSKPYHHGHPRPGFNEIGIWQTSQDNYVGTEACGRPRTGGRSGWAG